MIEKTNYIPPQYSRKDEDFSHLQFFSKLIFRFRFLQNIFIDFHIFQKTEIYQQCVLFFSQKKYDRENKLYTTSIFTERRRF
jgi:hypothetical protein